MLALSVLASAIVLSTAATPSASAGARLFDDRSWRFPPTGYGGPATDVTGIDGFGYVTGPIPVNQIPPEEMPEDALSCSILKGSRVLNGTRAAVIKYEPNSNIRVWAEYLIVPEAPPNAFFTPYAITHDLAGNVYITGEIGGLVLTDPDGGSGAAGFVGKFDSQGNQIWHKVLPNASCRDITVDSSNRVFVVAASGSVEGGSDFKFVRLDQTGNTANVTWTEPRSSFGNFNDVPTAIAVLDGLGVYGTGYCETASNGRDYFTPMLDYAGGDQGTHQYNGPGNGDDEAKAIIVTAGYGVPFGETLHLTGSSASTGGFGLDCITIQYKMHRNMGIRAVQVVRRFRSTGINDDIGWSMSRGLTAGQMVVGCTAGNQYQALCYDFTGNPPLADGLQVWNMPTTSDFTHRSLVAQGLWEGQGCIYVGGSSGSQYKVYVLNPGDGSIMASRSMPAPTPGVEAVSIAFSSQLPISCTYLTGGHPVTSTNSEYFWTAGFVTITP
jgi:hypothetical protein